MKRIPERLYWSSDCGHVGFMDSTEQSLAGQVRAAREDHNLRFPKCDMVDIHFVGDQLAWNERNKPVWPIEPLDSGKQAGPKEQMSIPLSREFRTSTIRGHPMIPAIETYPVQYAFSPECQLADLQALLDSYAVEFSVKGEVRLRMPIQYLSTYYSALDVRNPHDLPPVFVARWPSEIDGDFDLRMIPWNPSPQIEVIEDELVEWPSYHREPFYVDAPLKITFSFKDQWWHYEFSPGKTYTERSMQ